MTTKEVANRLIELCRKGEWVQAQTELYHPEVHSIEPKETGGAESKGLDKVFEKNKKWAGLTEQVHNWEVSDPLIADGYFCCTMLNDVTIKGLGRILSKELCVYQVVDGKIVSERFFHGPSQKNRSSPKL